MRVEPLVAEARIAGRSRAARRAARAARSRQLEDRRLAAGAVEQDATSAARRSLRLHRSPASTRSRRDLRRRARRGAPLGSCSRRRAVAVAVAGAVQPRGEPERAALLRLSRRGQRQARASARSEAALVQIKQQRKDTALAVARAYWSVRRLALLRDVQQSALAAHARGRGGRRRRGCARGWRRPSTNRATLRRLQQMATLADLDGQAARGGGAARRRARRAPTSSSSSTSSRVPEQPPPSPAELLRRRARRPARARRARSCRSRCSTRSVRIARSSFYPQLTLFGLFQYGNNAFNVGTGARVAVVGGQSVRRPRRATSRSARS